MRLSLDSSSGKATGGDLNVSFSVVVEELCAVKRVNVEMVGLLKRIADAVEGLQEKVDASLTLGEGLLTLGESLKTQGRALERVAERIADAPPGG